MNLSEPRILKSCLNDKTNKPFVHFLYTICIDVLKIVTDICHKKDVRTTHFIHIYLELKTDLFWKISIKASVESRIQYILDTTAVIRALPVQTNVSFTAYSENVNQDIVQIGFARSSLSLLRSVKLWSISVELIHSSWLKSHGDCPSAIAFYPDTTLCLHRVW